MSRPTLALMSWIDQSIASTSAREISASSSTIASSRG